MSPLHFTFISPEHKIYQEYVFEAESALNQFVKSSILELDNKSEIYHNYNGAECPNTTGLDKFLFSFKIIRIRDSQQKEKKRKDRNDDKKMNW